MRRRQEPPENHERWLVSYADFITLLFAFFVVMYAHSQVNKERAQQISEAVKRALEEGQLSNILSGLLGARKDRGNAPATALQGREQGGVNQPSAGFYAELLPSLELLREQLKAEIEEGKMSLSMEPRGLVITLRQAAFFPSGGDTIAPETYPSLQKVADAIRHLPNPVRLEGHTDSIPIRNARFRSNWELSAARSIAMLELFTTRYKLPRERLAIAGYAETIPVDTNETEEGRAHNRRVDIVVLNKAGLTVEPAMGGPHRQTTNQK